MEKTRLLDTSRRSLDDIQVVEAFEKFKDMAQELERLPQTVFTEEIEDEKRRSMIKFISKSYAYNVPIPYLKMELYESCSGLESVKTIQVNAENCGLCRGGAVAKFTNKNFRKLDQALINAFSLYKENHKTSLMVDVDQLKFNKVIENCEKAINYHEKSVKNKNNYTHREEYIGKNRGELRENRDDKTFRLELEELTADQVMKLGEMLPTL